MDTTDSGASFGEPFDQTNNQVPGLEGDSDGTAASDTRSAAQRGDGEDADEVDLDPGEADLDDQYDEKQPGRPGAGGEIPLPPAIRPTST
jgi:hypothetical protein